MSGPLSRRVINVGDLRRMAQRRLPAVVFDYLDGGADGEITLRENCRAFEDITFRPRQAVSLGQCDLQTRVLNFNLSVPAILAPVGYSRMMHPGGEVAAARAAGAAGTAYILSTISGHKVGRCTGWFDGPRLVSAVSCGRASGGGIDPGTRAEVWLFRARRHH